MSHCAFRAREGDSPELPLQLESPETGLAS
jgi:hypothetical protein